jgi:uncharacterized protein (UPF0147 family)
MEIKEVIEKIDDALNDYSMPRRIKTTLTSLKAELMNEGGDKALRITSAIYMIDEVANDVNIPMHSKTTLWDIISDLEALKK